MMILLCAAGIVFVITLWLVVSGRGMALDERVSAWIFTKRTKGLTKVMLFFTNWGKGLPTAAVCLALVLLSVLDETFWRVPVYSVLSTIITCRLFKSTVKRARPEGNRLVEETDYSFPSAHALGAGALYGSVILSVAVTGGPAGIIAAITAVVFLVGIGLSRVYLGVHYLIDVIGGWSLGLLTAAVFSFLPG